MSYIIFANVSGREVVNAEWLTSFTNILRAKSQLPRRGTKALRNDARSQL